MLQHPNIWKFSAILVVLNVITLAVCIHSGNTRGITFNGFFLVINAVALIGNLLLRGYRVKLQEQMKADRRQELIRLTIGE